jgi:hypothetical protein
MLRRRTSRDQKILSLLRWRTRRARKNFSLLRRRTSRTWEILSMLRRRTRRTRKNFSMLRRRTRRTWEILSMLRRRTSKDQKILSLLRWRTRRARKNFSLQEKRQIEILKSHSPLNRTRERKLLRMEVRGIFRGIGERRGLRARDAHRSGADQADRSQIQSKGKRLSRNGPAFFRRFEASAPSTELYATRLKQSRLREVAVN